MTDGRETCTKSLDLKNARILESDIRNGETDAHYENLGKIHWSSGGDNQRHIFQCRVIRQHWTSPFQTSLKQVLTGTGMIYTYIWEKSCAAMEKMLNSYEDLILPKEPRKGLSVPRNGKDAFQIPFQISCQLLHFRRKIKGNVQFVVGRLE